MAHYMIFARYQPAVLKTLLATPEESVNTLRRAWPAGQVCYPPTATPVPEEAPEVMPV